MSIQPIIQWKEGAPDEILPGMAIITSEGLDLVGTHGAFVCSPIIRHAQLIHPYELEWAESMANKRELGK